LGLATFFAHDGHTAELLREILFGGASRRVRGPALVELGSAFFLGRLVLFQRKLLHGRRCGLRWRVIRRLLGWSVGTCNGRFFDDVDGVFVSAPAAVSALLRAALLVRLLVLVTPTALVLVVAIAASVPAVRVPAPVLAPVITAILSITRIRDIAIVFSTALASTVVAALASTVVAAVVAAVAITARPTVVVIASGSRDGSCRCLSLGLRLHLRRGLLVTLVQRRERVSHRHPFRFLM